MAENMMNSEHKSVSDSYRKGYDRIFKKPVESKGRNMSDVKHQTSPADMGD